MKLIFYLNLIHLGFRNYTIPSSHRKFSVKKGVLRNFENFTGKHLFQSFFFNKVLSQKEALAEVFSCEFCEISKNAFSTIFSAIFSVFTMTLKFQ